MLIIFKSYIDIWLSHKIYANRKAALKKKVLEPQGGAGDGWTDCTHEGPPTIFFSTGTSLCPFTFFFQT